MAGHPCLQQYGKGLVTAGESAMIFTPTDKPITKALIAMHGHGQIASIMWNPVGFDDATYYATGRFNARIMAKLAHWGWGVICPDAGGNVWGADQAMSAMDDARAYALAKWGIATPDGFGFSMGGLTLLAHIALRGPVFRRAVCVDPASSIVWAHDNNPTWQAEVEGPYGGAAWSANSASRDPQRAYASIVAAGTPIRVYHGTADTTVPISHSQTFVGLANSDHVTLRTVTSADHLSVFKLLPHDEIARFLDTGSLT